ncbi:MAG TPA: SRPBCC domain-containing protein [Acidimicrobiia bacterium]|jgi:uncharacterized protein YndB with AHSA1/START domain|nr:SRPBCC domain-containing protein [Acidimicrobiia bacterium]
MTVKTIHKDAERLAMTITAEFDAPVERVWQLWDDPRQLEQWWGPPEWPATVVDHDLTPDGRINYYMTGPEGEKAHGWWRVVKVDPPRHLEFEDGFALDLGVPNPEMPVMTIRVTLEEEAAGTRMAIETTFPSRAAMDQMLEMQMDEGMAAAMGQMDDIIRATPTPGA